MADKVSDYRNELLWRTWLGSKMRFLLGRGVSRRLMAVEKEWHARVPQLANERSTSSRRWMAIQYGCRRFFVAEEV
jgi:hypothetical protein